MSMRENVFVVEHCPFYRTRVADDHISILSFNNIPLSDSLIEGLMNHPELFPDDIRLGWTQEQDLILEATLGELRGHVATR